MSELLSPAGNLESFKAAIANGADAIYLGLDKFSARAYASNFSLDNFKEILDYAHIRNVRIFVTINTIIYDFELESVFNIIDQLTNMGADAIIVQDLAIFNYIVNKYKSLEAHISTQVGIDDIYGAKLVNRLGASRIVMAREANLETIKLIKDTLKCEIEVFIHGANCVCYSGNCLMSSSIGERSGNRGRCAGTCRKPYQLIDKSNNKIISHSYLLSMKDTNTANYIKDMSFIDSFKIEGRMKEPNYVASITNIYRKIIDNENVDINDLNKVFNRTYSKGYINNEAVENITNITKPNNYGYEIGKVVNKIKNKVYIKLNSTLNKGDQIRISTNSIFDEISIPVTKMFDFKGKEIVSSNNEAVVFCNENVSKNSLVFKTKDIIFFNNANKSITDKIYKPIPIDMEFNAYANKNLNLIIKYKDIKVSVDSESIIEKAINNPTTKTNIINQLSKLNDTVYKINNLIINYNEDLFIPLKLINELRREGINKLNNIRLENKLILNDKPIDIIPKKYELIKPEIVAEVNTLSQYQIALNLGIKHIYYKNIVNRNNANYVSNYNEILVGGLNGIEYYKDKNINIVTDYSLNIVNHISVALLSSLNVDRITLSEEISKEDINNLVDNYYAKYNTYPNLELKIYGRTKLMHTKYCPLKRLNLCGECKKNSYILKDEYSSFPLKFNDDCTVFIYSEKILNLINDIKDLKGVNYYRLTFTDETIEEMEYIINLVNDVINNKEINLIYDKNKYTKGHFYKRPL